MLDDQQREHVGKMTMTLQIITAAMAGGVLVFAGIVLVVFQDGDQPNEEVLPLIAYLAAGIGIVACVLSALLPRLIDSINRKNFTAGNFKKMLNTLPNSEAGDIGLFVGMYKARFIISVAILEGAAFFNLIANMLEGQIVNLIMAALLFVAIFLKFPTQSSVEDWIETERKTIKELGSLQN